MSTTKTPLSYQRLLEIVDKLVPEEGSYVMAFVLNNERKCIERCREFECARDDAKVKRSELEALKQQRALLQRDTNRISGAQQQIASFQKVWSRKLDKVEAKIDKLHRQGAIGHEPEAAEVAQVRAEFEKLFEIVPEEEATSRNENSRDESRLCTA